MDYGCCSHLLLHSPPLGSGGIKEGGWGHFPPPQPEALPPTCLQSEEQNGINQPFLAKFWRFAPSDMHFSPLMTPTKNFWCRHWPLGLLVGCCIPHPLTHNGRSSDYYGYNGWIKGEQHPKQTLSMFCASISKLSTLFWKVIYKHSEANCLRNSKWH